MDQLGEMMQAAVNCDYDALLGRAKEAVESLTPKLDAVDKEATQYVLFAIGCAAIFADGAVSDLERKLLREVFTLDEEIMEQLDAGLASREEGMKVVLEFSQVVDGDTRADILMLSMAFAAVDKIINKEESAYIRKLCE